jgi:1-pyrroline-5-carboxylate dehydrogenase
VISGFAHLQPPAVVNEPVKTYLPGSAERQELLATLARMKTETIDMPSIIGGKPLRTGRLETSVSPHDHQRILGQAHLCGTVEVEQAVQAAIAASHDWGRTPWEERAAVFLRAADLLSGPWRARLNAATMLGQSKTAHQAEIDSAAELADFWRFNVAFMHRLYADQPISSPGMWNRVEYRPLEGFVYAVSPFNFTAIAGNLPSAPALMGNAVVWKPSNTAKYSAHFIMELLQAAGLPDGVINLVYGDPQDVTQTVLADRRLAGLHFTGSTEVFSNLSAAIAGRSYRAFPRIVGETGGKNFLLAHASADVDALTAAVVRGAFEYQGQKCSALSRLFVPQSKWPALKARLCDEIASIKVGDVDDLSNFMGAVIDQRAFDRLSAAIGRAKQGDGAACLQGGATDDTTGYFVRPTLLQVDSAESPFMSTEFFGPIVSAFVYDDSRFEDMITTIDETSAYGLTGSIFADDRRAVDQALSGLRHAAGTFYINDKPTGAVVGQQPFGGARASGTNDKAGSMWNLMRWVSPRTIKETFVPPIDYRYPFLAAEPV